MKGIKFLFSYVKRHKWKYLAGIIILFVVDYVSLFIPEAIGIITDGLNTHSIGMSGIYKQIGTIIMVGITLAVGRFFWRYFIIITARKVERDIRNDLFTHLETLDIEYYNSHKTGGLMAHFTNDVNAVRMAMGPGVISAFDAVVMTFLVVSRMITHINLTLTLLALIPMMCILFGELWFGKLIQKPFKESQEAYEELTDYTQESISGIHVIKSFVREENQIQDFLSYNKNMKKKNLKAIKYQAVEEPLLSFVIGLSSLITLIFGGYYTMIGTISLGEFVSFHQYLGMLVWPMLAAGEAIIMLSRAGASSGRIEEILNSRPEVEDLIEDQDTNLMDLEGRIEFRNLTFCHKGQLEPTLKNVSFCIEAGQTAAIVGRTGSGKSTIVNLLLHLYPVNEGMIFLDQKDICSYSLQSLRGQIAYVPQDNFLFSDSLQNNIAFGVQKKEIEKVMDAAKDACIHDNIMDFPQKYETVVGERGVTLSGGQKQRSSIARALIKDAPIMIMDDSLSAVDTSTEEKILDNLKKNRSNKTNLLIAHRITTIQNADVIVVLEEGQVEEIGTHQELMERQGIYYQMYLKQQLEARREEGILA